MKNILAGLVVAALFAAISIDFVAPNNAMAQSVPNRSITITGGETQKFDVQQIEDLQNRTARRTGHIGKEVSHGVWVRLQKYSDVVPIEEARKTFGNIVKVPAPDGEFFRRMDLFHTQKQWNPESGVAAERNQTTLLFHASGEKEVTFIMKRKDIPSETAAVITLTQVALDTIKVAASPTYWYGSWYAIDDQDIKRLAFMALGALLEKWCVISGGNTEEFYAAADDFATKIAGGK